MIIRKVAIQIRLLSGRYSTRKSCNSMSSKYRRKGSCRRRNTKHTPTSHAKDTHTHTTTHCITHTYTSYKYTRDIHRVDEICHCQYGCFIIYFCFLYISRFWGICRDVVSDSHRWEPCGHQKYRQFCIPIVFNEMNCK